ncbi:hypothetical protein FJTKL_01820 [Diaporthe vaccinii]|uniref:Integral membrane protein n=1 Tax=Diaporthe vaccinii TaxID=105482 RepID=A0ABR4F4E3_9PEZI
MPVFNLSHIPAAAPPPGVIPNFVNPPSQANMPRIFTYVTLPLMILFLALRIYARAVIMHRIGLDDYLSLLASATFIVYTILLFTTLDNPGGPHMWDVPVSKITVYYVRGSAHLTTATQITHFKYAWL